MNRRTVEKKNVDKKNDIVVLRNAVIRRRESARGAISTIVPMSKKDVKAVSLLICRALRLLSPGQPKRPLESLISFLTCAQDPKQSQAYFEENPFRFVAKVRNRIVGVVYGKHQYVLGLYVDASYAGRGIGAHLLHRFEQSIRRRGQSAVRLRAFPSAVSFYLDHGYVKTTGMRKVEGLWMQPMKKVLI